MSQRKREKEKRGTERERERERERVEREILLISFIARYGRGENNYEFAQCAPLDSGGAGSRVR
jgi:hypothetical protein